MLLPLRFVAQATQNWRNTKNPLAERLGFFVWSPTALGLERGEQPLSNGLRHPASASCLGRHLRLAGRCPNNCSLFLPLAAVAVVALRGGWSPEVGRGDSKHPSLPLAQRSVPGGDDFYKSYEACPTRPLSAQEATFSVKKQTSQLRRAGLFAIKNIFPLKMPRVKRRAFKWLGLR